MVTAELAAVLPAVVLVLVTALAGMGLVIDQIRCVDAARVAARAASRGDQPQQVRDVATRMAPKDAVIDIRDGDNGGSVEVTVTADAHGLGAWLPERLRPSATVVVPRELTGVPP